MPAGTVTFMFTDIEGSTAGWERHAEGMSQAVRIHDTLAREVVESGDGVIFKMTGDGVCAAFSDPRQAVESALGIRRRLQEAPWPAGVAPLVVRTAIHTGTAESREGDYAGPPLNRVARLMEAAHGGQILISQTTCDLIDGEFGLEDLGWHRLRDLLEPEHIYQVGEPGERHPPLRTLDSRHHNLPTQVTPFVGREHEVAELVRLIATSPLVTLTGPGGTGKTRLALQTAAELVDQFDSVVFIGLGPVTEADRLAPTIADVLGLAVTRTPDLHAALASYLASRRHLLILDNFEQLMAAASVVGGLIDAVPDLRVVITSRELLRLRAEQNYPVDPLPVPILPDGAGLMELAGFESVRLFEQRARAVRPDFTLDETNAADVAEICRRLDGLPLAIELAAARVRILPPAGLRSALASDLGVLGSGPQDAPDRQRTLHSTIRWSYALLDDIEQTVFRRLSVFAGGCGPTSLAGVALFDLEVEALAAMEALADKSLVRIETDRLGEPRISLLETIRTFAWNELEQSGEVEEIRDRHAAHYAEMSEQAEGHLRGKDQIEWFTRLDRERDNLEAALDWSFSGDHPISGLRLVAALRDYWFYQGDLRMMGRWAEVALPRVVGQDPLLEAGVALTAGFHAYSAYRPEAPELMRRAAEMYRVAGDDTHHALALIFQLGAEDEAGHDPDIETGLAEAVALARRAGAEHVVAQAFNFGGEIERTRGNYKEARALQLQSLEVARRTGEVRRVAMILNNLGLIAHHMGDQAEARSRMEASLRLSVELGFEANAWHAVMALSEQVALAGDLDVAARLIGATEAHFHRVGLLPQPEDARDFARIRADIARQLGDERFRAALEAGSGLQLDEAAALVLDDDKTAA